MKKRENRAATDDTELYTSRVKGNSGNLENSKGGKAGPERVEEVKLEDCAERGGGLGPWKTEGKRRGNRRPV